MSDRGDPASPAGPLVLVLVLAVLTISYASSMRAYLQQRSQISDLKAQIALRQTNIDRLEREKRRWHDPAYVEGQARARFGYLMPGEKSYVVIGEDGKPLDVRDHADRPGHDRPQGAHRVVERGVALGAAGRAPAEAPGPARDPDRRVEAVSPVDPADLAAVAAQLGREPRAIHEIGHRCPCGNPDVVTTLPRLPNGTPFPTTYYLTCPRAASRIGTLEGSGTDEARCRTGWPRTPTSRAAYAAAHERYLAARDELARANGQQVPEIDGISAGGMPDRVKCLHVLAGQALAQGPGVNPLGDEVLDGARRLVGRRALRQRGPDRWVTGRSPRSTAAPTRSSCWWATCPTSRSASRAWCASARTSTAPGGSPTMRWPGRSARSRSTPR